MPPPVTVCAGAWHLPPVPAAMPPRAVGPADLRTGAGDTQAQLPPRDIAPTAAPSPPSPRPPFQTSGDAGSAGRLTASQPLVWVIFPISPLPGAGDAAHLPCHPLPPLPYAAVAPSPAEPRLPGARGAAHVGCLMRRGSLEHLRFLHYFLSLPSSVHAFVPQNSGSFAVFLFGCSCHAGTAELPEPRLPWSRAGTDVLSLHPRDAKTLFCFHHQIFQLFHADCRTKGSALCPAHLKPCSLSWDGFGRCQRDDGQTHRQHRQPSQQKMCSGSPGQKDQMVSHFPTEHYTKLTECCARQLGCRLALPHGCSPRGTALGPAPSRTAPPAAASPPDPHIHPRCPGRHLGNLPEPPPGGSAAEQSLTQGSPAPLHLWGSLLRSPSHQQTRQNG